MIKYLCFLTFFIIISCSIFENDKFIPKEKLVNILIEMHVLEASIDNLNLSKDSSMIFFKMREKEIFEKFNIWKCFVHVFARNVSRFFLRETLRAFFV